MFDTGNTGFMLVATSLVMLMTPGLAFFYGGLVGRKNVLSIMIQSFVSMGVTTILWYAVGFSLCFSGGQGGIIGNLDMAFLRRGPHDSVRRRPDPHDGVHRLPDDVRHHHAGPHHRGLLQPRALRALPHVPGGLAAPGLLPLRPHDLGRRAAGKWGVLDFAGGIAVHNIAGMAALASVLFVGRRRIKDSVPHSIPLVALGTGLLWFGWYGFNAGSELKVDQVTAMAFLNTDVAASFAAITWLFIAWSREKKPKFVGLLTGAVAGLATITPAAGYVSPSDAALIGIVAGAVCYGAVSLKNALNWDDALDVWGVHGVGGALGIIMLGILATTAINPAGANGLIHGGSDFFMKELVAIVVSSIYAFAFTYIMLWIINKATPVRTSEVEEGELDASLLGESAYEYI